MKYHKTKDGKRILLTELEQSHLINILAFIERRAKEGVDVTFGGFSGDVDSMWYEADTLFGKKARKYLGYKHYKQELKRRQNVENT